MKEVRLDKFLSDNTSLSRSIIKKKIRAGSVLINQNAVKDAGLRLNPDCDEVFFQGKYINNKPFVYILLNKPKGILSAANDKNRKTVVDLAPENLKHYGLFPVGRLDKDTTGLLLLTNDGEFAHRVISPKSSVEKSYIALVDADIPENINDIFKNGVVLESGEKCETSTAVKIGDRRLKITVTEGKYHQIKRMLGTLGLGVNELHRDRIGGLFLPDWINTGDAVEIEKNTAFSVFKNGYI